MKGGAGEEKTAKRGASQRVTRNLKLRRDRPGLVRTLTANREKKSQEADPRPIQACTVEVAKDAGPMQNTSVKATYT